MRTKTRRTPAQERALYTGLSPRQFADLIGRTPELVYALIADGWFQWMEDGLPECMDVRKPGAKKPQYKIHPSAASRWITERACVGNGS